MPALIVNPSFKDIFNQSLAFYQSNAGDTQTFTCLIYERIQLISNSSTLFSYNPTTDTINIIGGNFLTEGFRAGDSIKIDVYHSNGNLKGTTTVDILGINASNIVVDNQINHWHDTTQGEYVIITVLYTKSGDKRNGLWLDVNLTKNGITGTEFSLIDNEVTRFIFNLTGTTFNQVVNGAQVGFRSGQFNVVTTLKDKTTYPNTQRTYEITVGFINSGVYDSSNFDFSNCLKLYLGFNWQRVYNDPNNMYKYVFNDDANTGWFDEAFNVGVIDATLVQAISSIDYSQVNTGQISIDSASASFGFGASYIPTDENYYKSKTYTQSQLGMLCPSQTGTTPITITSPLNSANAGYTIEFSNPVTVGTVTTWDWEFTPNSQFITFMNNRAEGDRLFYVWAKYGNVNLLLFKDQLTKPVAQGDPLNMITHNFVDHSQNITDNSLIKNGFTGNVEDDIAFIGKFLVENYCNIEYVKGEFYAVNSVSNEEFLLSSVYFDFTSVPKVSGKYPINQSIEVITTLPNTSEKLRAILVRDNSIDTATEYGFRIYVPFFYKWEYWLSQPNADGDFYPNEQTQNWTPYANTANWSVVFRASANINTLDSIFEDTLIINDYDSDSNVTQTMDLQLVSTNQNVGIIVENEIHKVKAYHTLTTGTWDQLTVWGMITIEPTESNPRWICSTIVPFDNDLQNPLYPISGLLATLTFPSPNVALIECYFDPSKMNLSNGVKFTSKIKGYV